jgi:hypothetical protein
MTMVDVEGGAGNDVGRDRLRGEKEEKELGEYMATSRLTG